MPRGFWKGLFKVLAFFAVIGGIAIAVLRVWFVDVVTVRHNGMAPTMVLGDRVLVWRDAELERNDIGLCRHPQDPARWVIGRVAVMPGGEIAAERGQLRLGRDRVTHDVRGQVQFTDGETGHTYPMAWGIEEFDDYEEHLFFDRSDRQLAIRAMTRMNGLYLLGDNRAHVGEDSRTFGPVQASGCRGQVFIRLTAAEGGLPAEIPHGMLDILD
ncbi:signal peptidase I [Sandaracinus amylolyticus]|uniref:signal peptidase I n=1 Tax=Sandaracinus amylolyticus TaxID=927083 RepID=UPI001F01F126|nr:signal peptidase I [Sandaracinus amylolyticus]UJR81599.1 Signal peptidase I [Sandaracinus amylolyticus]